MSPIDESGLVYAYDPSSRAWTSLKPTSSTYPEPRSYHSAASAPGQFIIHGGCAAVGRLNDTWSFDINTRAWKRLADAPGLGRGGTALTVADGRVFRFGGFDGKTEAGGAIDSLGLSASPGSNAGSNKGAQEEWKSTVFGEQTGLGRDAAQTKLEGKEDYPGPRSVSGLHHVGGDRLILLYGEGRPSHTGGHDAAGSFWDDVWAYDPKEQRWSKVEITGDKPDARGWFASDAGEVGLALSGGLDDSNTRLSDTWVLRFD